MTYRYRTIIRNSNCKIGYTRHRSSEPQKESIHVDIVLVILIVSARSAVTFHATDEKTVITQPMIRDELDVALRIHISSLATQFHRRCYTLPSFTGRGRNAARLRLRTQFNFRFLQKFDINENIDNCHFSIIIHCQF